MTCFFVFVLRQKEMKNLQHHSKKNTKQLQRINTQLSEIQTAIQKATQELEKNLEPQIKMKEKELGGDSEFVHALNIDRRVRKANRDLQKLIKEREAVDAQIAEFSPKEKVEEDATHAQAQVRQLQKEMSQLDGRIQELESSLQTRESLLRTKKFRGIDERHRKQVINVETVDMAVQDLAKYYKALDASLMRFHTLKIKKINSIINELWHMMYNGRDIEKIEIRSSESKNKRTNSYQYSLVMTKGGTELDMRGRCSAGQKVTISSIYLYFNIASHCSFELNPTSVVWRRTYIVKTMPMPGLVFLGDTTGASRSLLCQLRYNYAR